MSTCAATHLAQIGRIDRLASLNLNVTVLDLDRGSPVMAFVSHEAAKVASTTVRQRGYLPGASRPGQGSDDCGKSLQWRRRVSLHGSHVIRAKARGRSRREYASQPTLWFVVSRASVVRMTHS